VTLVPAMSEQAEHVTMLQRSPTYIVSRPSEDALANWMNRHLPKRVAYTITRWKIILFGIYFYFLTRRKPELVKQQLIDMVREELGDDFDVDTHFTPTYNPWDQRLCLVPDSDLFNAMKAGKVSVVTDYIERFTENGILLKSGKTLEADIIVTATGLLMTIMNGIQVVVDDEPIHISDTMSYKGLMYSNIPNLASSFGYTNASWTLKCELICEYVCRLLNYMDRHAYSQCTPRLQDASVQEESLINFSSGYVQRALDSLPSQGSERPWKVYQNYVLDMMNLRYGKLDDGVMVFSKKR
jgi:cation diffusion facilitator CzcD-associated flavoprotein CzcO